MPYINIRIAKDDTVTAKKKAELIEKTTAVVSEVLGKSPKFTYVVIDEVDPDNWGVGGETIATIRKKKSS